MHKPKRRRTERLRETREKNQAKALKAAPEVAKGVNVLKIIDRFGIPKLNSLTLPDLLALPINANPQGIETKPKSKT